MIIRYIADTEQRTFSKVEKNAVVSVKNDYEVNIIRFLFPIGSEDTIDITSAVKIVNYQHPGDTTVYREVLSVAESDETYSSYLAVDWKLPEALCRNIGTVNFAFMAYTLDDQNRVDQKWHSLITSFQVQNTLEGEEPEIDDETERATYAMMIEAMQASVYGLRTAIERLGGATPKAVNYSNEFVDNDRVYIYTGSEEDYLPGYWYYHDDRQDTWEPGGLYGVAIPDSELDLNSDNPVKNKVIAAELTGLNERLEQLEQGGAGEGVPSEVRQALVTLLTKALYNDTGLTDEKAVLQSWATEVTDITISQSAISISGAGTSQLTAVTSPAGGLITWSSSNPAVATVSSNGLVTGVSNGTATITASCGGKKATCTATVAGFATLTGITAVYSGGSVYDTATLNDLKSDLVVTASYDNSTTATVTDYTLTGSLDIGTNTITVSYGGFTDTFTVTVTENLGTLLYSWDFTNNNLTDSINNVVAQTTATQVTGGIKFESADKYLVLNPSSTMSLKNKKVAIDIASMSNGGSYHSRLFSVTTASDYKTNTSADSFMWKSSNDGWYVYNGSWSTSKLAKADYPGSYFSGKTLVLTFDSSGYPTVSVDGTDLLTYDKAMARTGYLVFGGSNTDQLYRLAPTISGVRIYEVA